MELGNVVLNDGWDAPNGTAVDPARWTTAASIGPAGMTINIQNNGLRFALAGATGSYNEFGGVSTLGRVLTGNGDFQLQVDFSVSSTAAESYGEIAIGDSHNGGGIPFNGIFLQLNPQGNQLEIQHSIAGAQTSVGVGTFIFTANVQSRLIWRRENGTVYAKAWQLTNQEPSAWAIIDNSDAVNTRAFRGPGYGTIMLGFLGGFATSSTTLTFDNLIVTELDDGESYTLPEHTIPASGLPLGNASSTFTAYGQTANARTVNRPDLTLTAYDLSSPRTITQAAISLIANNVSLLSPKTLGSANIGFTAYDQTVSSRSLGLASLGFTAFDQSVTSNKALGLASLAFTANNASILTSYSLGLASLGFSANSLSIPRTQALATIAFAANALSSPRQSNVASFSLTAYTQSRTLIQALALASISFTAFNESLTQISSLPLGLASFSLAALDLTPFILRSAGLATLGLTAAPSTTLRPTQDAVAGLSTAAYPVSVGSGRSVSPADLQLNAYDISLLTEYTEEVASLSFGAFNVHLFTPGTTKIKYTIKGMVLNETVEGMIKNTSIGGNVTNKTIGGDVSQ